MTQGGDGVELAGSTIELGFPGHSKESQRHEFMFYIRNNHRVDKAGYRVRVCLVSPLWLHCRFGYLSPWRIFTTCTVADNRHSAILNDGNAKESSPWMEPPSYHTHSKPTKPMRRTANRTWQSMSRQNKTGHSTKSNQIMNHRHNNVGSNQT